MATRYVSEIHERVCCGKIFTIENVKPKFSLEEEKNIKTDVESQLYDVFIKYFPQKP